MCASSKAYQDFLVQGSRFDNHKSGSFGFTWGISFKHSQSWIGGLINSFFTSKNGKNNKQQRFIFDGLPKTDLLANSKIPQVDGKKHAMAGRPGGRRPRSPWFHEGPQWPAVLSSRSLQVVFIPRFSEVMVVLLFVEMVVVNATLRLCLKASHTPKSLLVDFSASPKWWPSRCLRMQWWWWWTV